MLEVSKPLVEVFVEGELSPFEHEALYQILRRKFSLEHPTYVELPDEDLATRVNIIFHHAFNSDLFTKVLQESWHQLKDLLKQVRHRRGRAGAAFSITFAGTGPRLVFKSGTLDYDAVASALDQIAHLTGIIGQMVRPESMSEPLGLIECSFDKVSDRWWDFRGLGISGDKRVYFFDEANFKWTVRKGQG